MSFDDITEINSDSSGDESESIGIESLAARVRDLEADVYGYSNDEESAGQQAVVDVKRTIVFLENRRDEDEVEDDRRGVPMEDIYRIAEVIGLDRSIAEQAYEKLRRMGEVYEPAKDEVRTT